MAAARGRGPAYVTSYVVVGGGSAARQSHLERVGWGEGFVRRFCGALDGDWWAVRRGLRRCALCRRETSVTAGRSSMAASLPLQNWFAAIWCHAAHHHPGGESGSSRPCSRGLRLRCRRPASGRARAWK